MLPDVQELNVQELNVQELNVQELDVQELDVQELDDVTTLRATVFLLENELDEALIRLRLSDTKITKLQESEFRLEEELLLMSEERAGIENKKLLIGQSIFNLVS